MLGVEPDWILCGNGSDEILTLVTRAFVAQGELLRLPYPSYVLYKTLARDPGCAQRRSLLPPRLDAARRVRRRRPPGCGWHSCRIRIVHRARWCRLQRVLELAERLPCPLLVDEAYVDFADGDCLRLVVAARR